jgi:excisionase family DNA binding protein
MQDSDDFLLTEEVGSLVRAPAETVRYWVHIGKAPRSIKVGRRRLFRRADVMAWIAARDVEQNGPSAA